MQTESNYALCEGGEFLDELSNCQVFKCIF
jgi:hypothetical protein